MQQKPISSLLQTILQKRNPAMRILIIFCIAMNFFSFNLPIAHAEKEDSPTQLTQKGPLVGAAAIEHLKQKNEYTALQSAFSETQKAISATFQQDAYVKASNTEIGDGFGYSVAMDGDTVVIGAPGESSNSTGVNNNQANNSASVAGAVYVFVRNGATWSQQAYLKASNSESGDAFGRQVAISEDTVVVSTINEDSSATGVNGNQNDNSAPESGAVYVFVRNGTSWSQQAYLKASSTDSNDFFGASIAISGDTIVVGADGERSSATGINGNQSDNSAVGAGAAYVFVRNGTAWSQQAYLKASNSEAGDVLGASVSIDGDTIIVGAGGEDSDALGINGAQNNNNALGSGAAYIFVRNGLTWSQQAYLKPSIANRRLFGINVSISGETVAIADVIRIPFYGPESISLFVRNGTSWSQQAVVTTGNNSSTQEGVSLSLSGNRLLVGEVPSAAAMVFMRTGTTWSLESTLQTSNAELEDRAGYASAISGDIIVIGAWGEDSNATGINGNQSDNSAIGAGAAYIFSIPPIPTCSSLTQEAETSNAILSGFSIATDPAASGGSYIGAPSGGNYYNGPNPSFKAEYCFTVPTAGTYRIKAKTYAADNLSDSFYVTIDGAPTSGYLWDVAQNTSYATDYVNDRNNADPVEVQLNAGQHVVTVYLREQGTRLDTIALEQVVTPPEPTCAGLVQEAESGVITGNWGIGNDGAASGGSYIHAPEGSGNFWNGANATQKASYCFNVATAGTYRIQGKVYGADTLSDSFYVQVDGQPSIGYLWDILPNTTYASDFVNDRGVVDPVEVQLSAGQHTVNVFVREDGTRLDTIELQLVDSGPPPTPVCAGLFQEAETGALSGNFTLGNDSAASGGVYVYTPVGSGDFWNGANARHRVSYCFNVPTAGTYRIDGKVYGADTLSDSFYVQVDGAPTSGYLWDVLRNTSYEIDSVNNRNLADPVLVTLSSGQHTVTVYARESGTRLDTIQLVATTPTPQSRAIPILAQGIHGTIQLNASNLSAEVDFSTIQLSLSDAETNGQAFRQTVTVDRFGNYHFDGMLPGRYVVQMQLPSGLLAETSAVTVTASADEPVNVIFEVSAGNKTYLPLIGR